MADAAEKLKGGMPEKHTTINENTDAHTDGQDSHSKARLSDSGSRKVSWRAQE